MQAQLAAQMRSQSIFNLVLLGVGFVMIVVIALFFLMR